MRIQTLLLAAGAGRRFGGDKLVAPLADGTPLVVASARSVVAAGCDVLAVVRAGSDVAPLLDPLPRVRIIASAESGLGLGRSIAAGVRASPRADGWLVTLGDMPFVRPETIAAVADALRGGGSLVAPFRSGRRGHPVGFGRLWRARLLALTGDVGARDLLTKHRDALTPVETDDPGIHRDLDYPDDPAWGAARDGPLMTRAMAGPARSVDARDAGSTRPGAHPAAQGNRPERRCRTDRRRFDDEEPA